MYNIIQTVHHDFGRKPSRSWYNSADDFHLALDMCNTFNVARAEKNQREARDGCADDYVLVRIRRDERGERYENQPQLNYAAYRSPWRTTRDRP